MVPPVSEEGNVKGHSIRNQGNWGVVRAVSEGRNFKGTYIGILGIGSWGGVVRMASESGSLKGILEDDLKFVTWGVKLMVSKGGNCQINYVGILGICNLGGGTYGI